ncbi:MAG: hypothetical protein JNL98_32150 [Bryobacterales bacterium]|nr:hypothetical protein [Bryobacterales bacterium]
MPSAKKRKLVEPPRRKPSRSHLLVIECDAEQLASEQMDLGSKFAQFVHSLMPQKRVVVVRANTEAELGRDLAEALQEHGVFRTVLIVGHSNEQGLKMTGDGLRSWTVVGRWLRDFAPEYLFLTACSAGRSGVVRTLFNEVDTLKEIYGSPILLDAYAHTAPIAAILISLLQTGRINAADSQAYRAVGYLLTGSQVYRWRKDETGPSEELNNALWDAAGEGLRLLRGAIG